MNYLKSYKIFESNKDQYHDLMMILMDLFDDWGIISHSTERFGDDEDIPEHKFWTFINSDGNSMTNNVDLTNSVKSIIIYNIPAENEDRFWDDLMSYKKQIEGITGKNFQVDKSEVNNFFSDYILRLI
jgi:hypothetical protein